jgi:EmrB/QacA subfamily drug resistance transporter
VSAGSVAVRQRASDRTAGPWAVLVVVCFAQFMVVLDATIVNVALPSIERGLSLSASNLQWVINAYSLTLGGFLLLGGRAGDILGRKRIFMAGLVLFSAASLANGLATSSLVLIIGRAVQGVGGALVVPAVLSIITTNFTTALDREKALAVWSAISATGGAVGLLLGGVLTSALSWRWIFLVNVPVGLLVMLATIRIVPESHAPDSKRSFDAAGAALVTAGLGVFVFAIVKSESYGWSSGLTWALLVGGLALIAAFLALERRSSAPLMRLGIFHTPGLGPASVIQVLTSGAAIATFFFVSLYLQQVLGFRPFSGGLALLPISAGIVGGATIARQAVPKFGPRAVARVGIAIGFVGLLVLSRVPIDGHYASNVLVGVLPLSLGLGLTFLPVTLIATNRVEAPDAGLASGILNTAQQMGATVGLAVLSTLAASRTLHGAAGARTLQIGGFHLAFDGAAAFLGAALLITALVLRSEPQGATHEEVHRDKAAQAAACAQQVPGAIR